MSWTTEYLVQRFTFDYDNAPAVTVGYVVDVTISGGGTTMPSGTAGQVPQVSTGSTYTLVTPNTANGLVRLDESATVPDILLPSSIARDSEITAAIAAIDVDDVDGRDIYAPVWVMSPASVTAFGGSMVDGVSVTIAALSGLVPSGVDILIWNGTNGGAPNGSYTSNGLGVFAYSSRQYLTSTSVGNGCVTVEAGDYYTSGATAQQSKWAITTANGTTWGLTATGGHAFTASLNLAQYATDADLTTAEGNLNTAAQARMAIVRAEPTVAFRHDGTNSGDWHADHVGSFTGGFDYRACVRPLYPDEPAGEWYSECGTQTRDSGVGSIDNHETAIQRGHAPTNAELVTDKPYLFFECTPTGETEEVAIRLSSDLHSTWGDWVTIRVTVNFATTTVRHWLQVGWEFDAAETFDTTADARTWWLIGELVDTGYDSIDTAITEAWQIGHNFYGDTAWHEYYSGIDGTRIASPSAATLEPGDTSYTDTEANVWTAQATAKVASLSVETAAADAAAQRTTLGVAPAPRLQPSGQYVGSGNIAATTSGLTNNRLFHIPILIPRDLTITRLAVNQVATGSAGASSVGKFGIYTNTGDLPAAAFDLPAGTIDLTTGTGLKYVSGSWALTAGIWWFSFVAQITSGSPTFSTSPPAIVVSSSDATNTGTKFEGGVTGTLPSTATPGAANTTGAPIIYLYV